MRKFWRKGPHPKKTPLYLLLAWRSVDDEGMKRFMDDDDDDDDQVGVAQTRLCDMAEDLLAYLVN